MDLRTLRRKLQAIEALHEGATTEGERAAAAEARERLTRRMAGTEGGRWSDLAEEGPDAASIEHPDPLTDEADVLPPLGEFLALLIAWEEEECSRDDVHAWAAVLCDRLLLPCVDITDPRAARVEVLLNLAAMDHQPLRVGDIPALRAFLTAEPGEAAWAAWFGFLAGIDWSARR